jgi:hypothetical protein
MVNETEANNWHRYFAVECNNRAWHLTAQPERSPAEDDEMLLQAYAAAYHWSRVGAPLNHMRADLALAHVHALLGHSELALRYAQRSLDYAMQCDVEDWDLAFAHAEMAHAAATAGDVERHVQHYAAAQVCGEKIADEEDRRVFFQEFGRIPQP